MRNGIEFDNDVRAGFAYAIEQVISGITELFDVDEEKLKKYEKETMAQLPDGVDAMFAILYSLVGFLLEENSEFAVKLLDSAAYGLQPAVQAHMGIVAGMMVVPPKETTH